MQQIIEEARVTEEPIMVLIDGEWYTARWVQGADDGSPYGTESFADENSMSMAEDMFEDARWPEENEAEHIPSTRERHEERKAFEEERIAGERADILRAKRQATANRRRELESRYLHAFPDSDPSQVTMSAMRSELKEHYRVQGMASLASVFNGLFSR